MVTDVLQTVLFQRLIDEKDSCSDYQWERFWGSCRDEFYGYGAVVMNSRHEGDGIYLTLAPPPATTTGLTI